METTPAYDYLLPKTQRINELLLEAVEGSPLPEFRFFVLRVFLRSALPSGTVSRTSHSNRSETHPCHSDERQSSRTSAFVLSKFVVDRPDQYERQIRRSNSIDDDSSARFSTASAFARQRQILFQTCRSSSAATVDAVGQSLEIHAGPSADDSVRCGTATRPFKSSGIYDPAIDEPGHSELHATASASLTS